MTNRALWVGLFGGAVAAALIGLFAVPALGIFNMSVTGKPGLLDWWGDTNLHSSLFWRAPHAKIPSTADAGEGMEHFKSTCLQCHGAPETAPAEWAPRMQPMPPELWQEGTQQMTDGELFYVVAQGVRMTGMPAFEPEHSPEEIWNIVAFVRELDNLTEQQKRQLGQAAEAYQHHHGGHAQGEAEGQ
jgi:mono/diheme cytochrome c family protein